MTEALDYTKQFSVPDDPNGATAVLATVLLALREKGYNPVTQLVGYLLSGDPTYITSHRNARTLIATLERDELLEELVRGYLGTVDRR